ncbi:hypothetical protein AC249_AIPGENE11568 [Exaiptasia diaphana]|nr:hypothetical protein AC249_AIPGENE11568 [Exaiptasia diaphana]
MFILMFGNPALPYYKTTTSNQNPHTNHLTTDHRSSDHKQTPRGVPLGPQNPDPVPEKIPCNRYTVPE